MKMNEYGFTFIELIVSLALLGLLASVVIPVSDLASRQSKERELKQALNEIRGAIDEYKIASDKNEIPLKFKTPSGYPPNLIILTGVPLENNRVRRFLRRIPEDPFSKEKGILAEKTWGLRSFASEAADPKVGDDVYDIYPLSEQKGTNGVSYREW